MQLQIDVNNAKANLFLEILNLLKKDKMIKKYEVVSKNSDYENEVLKDLENFGSTYQSATLGKGKKTSKSVKIDII